MGEKQNHTPFDVVFGGPLDFNLEEWQESDKSRKRYRIAKFEWLLSSGLFSEGVGWVQNEKTITKR